MVTQVLVAFTRLKGNIIIRRRNAASLITGIMAEATRCAGGGGKSKCRNHKILANQGDKMDRIVRCWYWQRGDEAAGHYFPFPFFSLRISAPCIFMMRCKFCRKNGDRLRHQQITYWLPVTCSTNRSMQYGAICHVACLYTYKQKAVSIIQ